MTIYESIYLQHIISNDIIILIKKGKRFLLKGVNVIKKIDKYRLNDKISDIYI